MPVMRMLLPLVLCLSGSTAAAQAQFSGVTETAVENGRQLKGQVALTVDGKPVGKRFVIRVPASAKATAGQAPVWNGSVVIGAHGGSGGNNFDRNGNVIGTDETALDDVIGRHAMANGFAYASFDREGAVSAPDGLRLTYEFTALAKSEVARLAGRAPARIYLVGLSMGGGITRLAAEDPQRVFAGTLIIAGAGGDLVTRLDRITKMAGLWPLIDPRAHVGMSSTHDRLRRYAEAVGSPVEARRLWPYTGWGAVAAAARPPVATETATGRVQVPTIEVAGTWDDLVIRELRAYRQRADPRALHRLYQVEGVWHMSSDDDGVMSFQYIATSRMKLDPDVADAMGQGPSYLPTVREAFDHLVDWVERRAVPPPSQTVKPTAKLRARP